MPAMPAHQVCDQIALPERLQPPQRVIRHDRGEEDAVIIR
jgi:hypothetical protein